MNNESQFTAKLLKALRAHPSLAEAVIFKHSDRINSGVPDFSITLRTKTIWVEVKVAPNTVTKIQSYYLARIGCGALIITKTEERSYSIRREFTWHMGLDFAGLIEAVAIVVVNP